MNSPHEATTESTCIECSVAANGARIFENNELIQPVTWDDAIVDKALAHF